MDEAQRGDIRVVKLLDKQNVVINKGSTHGVAVGQRFIIYESGDEVVDPTSGESLGKLEVFKARATVIHAQERMATLRAEARQKERPKPLSEIMATLSGKEPEADTLGEIRVGDLAKPEAP